MPHIAVDGARRLNYRLDGPEDAPVVMFSNSLGSDLGMWADQLPALSGRFRVLRYDHCGHGGSDVAEGDYRMERLAEDALALLDGLGIERVRVCGLSMGGAIGQWLAANHPDRVERLALSNTAAVFATPEVWQQRLELVRKDGMGAVVEATIERWFTPAWRESHPDRVAAIRAMLLATSPVAYAGCCAALRDTDYRALLPRIAAPTLVIGGLHDQATPPARAEELAAGIPGARLVMLDAAHVSSIEQAQAFNALLTDFFA
jgi:3-oxoadipate enol-lactonase